MENKKIVFATNNLHKLKEIKAIIGDRVDVLSLNDIGCVDEIPETADTIAGNALMKARYIVEKYGIDCFADDTGLEVEALDGRPGVHTARFASEMLNCECDHDAEANMKVLLNELKNTNNRGARFVTYIAYITAEGVEKTFEGICPGKIAEEKSGDNGFGYDPIFIPDETGGKLTFAQLDECEKNAVSHRGKATTKFIDYIVKQNRN